MKTVAIVLAAGRGARLGGATPKAFVPLRGRTLIERSVAALLAVREIEGILPVVPAEVLSDPSRSGLALPEDRRLLAPIPGGAERQDSVALGVAALPPSSGSRSTTPPAAWWRPRT